MKMNLAFIKDEIKDYINTQIDIVKLDTVSKVEKLIANTVLAIVLAITGFFVLLFFSMAAAVAISTATAKPFLGFLLVGGFYVLIALLIIALKQKLLNAPIINVLLKKIKYKKSH
jgi:hypothetical protein